MKLPVNRVQERANKKAHFPFLYVNLNSCLLLCQQLCVLQLQRLLHGALLHASAFCFVISNILTQTSVSTRAGEQLGEGGWMESAGAPHGPRSRSAAPRRQRTPCPGWPASLHGLRLNSTRETRGRHRPTCSHMFVKSVVKASLMHQICCTTRS